MTTDGIVTLEPNEFSHAAHAGFLRMLQNVLEGRADTRGFQGDGWEIHVMGAVAEFVAAKYLGLFWAGPGTIGGPDVGDFVQVRSAKAPHHRLIVHEDDNDEDAFVLVTGTGLAYRVRGWLFGREAKRPKFMSDPVGGRPAYFVPADRLRPAAKLKEVCRCGSRSSWAASSASCGP